MVDRNTDRRTVANRVVDRNTDRRTVADRVVDRNTDRRTEWWTETQTDGQWQT